MNVEQRLAEVITALEGVGVKCLVMGGHSARYYGLERMTDDFDLHLAPECFDDLTERLDRSDWFRSRKVAEVPSWRARSFRRFQIGTLASGREEWLEFWKENHLLPSFADAYSRCERGNYGGRMCDFLSLPDLIRAKETEREKDWVDIQAPQTHDLKPRNAVGQCEAEGRSATGDSGDKSHALQEDGQSPHWMDDWCDKIVEALRKAC